MTILCANGTHVYLTGQPRCTCGQAANGYPQGSAMIYYPANYNPFGPRQPKPDPPLEVSLPQMQGARAIDGATHLSADGERVYVEHSDGLRVHYWDEGAKVFGSSFPCSELPADAVRL